MSTEDQPITEAASTEAVETSAAVPTDLAWSHESDTTELPRRDWRSALLWAALVALLCSMVGAVTWFSTVYYRQSARPTVPTTSAATRPPAPPTTATVTVIPAPAAVPPTNQPAPSTIAPALSATDQQFLEAIDAPSDQAQFLIEHAHAVCDHIASHPDAPLGSTILDDWIASTAGQTGRVDSATFAYASVTHYCPQRMPANF